MLRTHGLSTLAAIVLFAVVVLETGAWAAAGEGQPYAGETVTIALHLLDRTKFYIDNADELLKKTGIKLNVQMLPELHLHEKVLMDLATGKGEYDIVAIDCLFVPQFAAAGWIAPLDQWVQKDGVNLDELFLRPFTDVLRAPDGKLYAIPYYGIGAFFMARKDLMAAAGVGVPRTFDELAAAAKKLHNPPSVYGIVMSGQPGQGMNVFRWAPFFRSMGGTWFDENWRPAFNQAEGVASVRFYAELLQKYGPPGVANYDWSEVQIAFQQGKAAIIFDATDFAPRMEDPSQSKVVGKVEYFNIPAGKRRESELWSWGLAISNYSKKKGAAWEVLKWMASKEMLAKWAWEWNQPDFSRPFIASDPRAAKVPYAAATVEAYQIGNPDLRPRLPEWKEIGDLVGIAVSAAIAGTDPQKAMDEAASEVNKIMALAGYYSPGAKKTKGEYDPETGRIRLP